MMTWQKGVAVSQIIMLVLGILVLAVVAFLLYSNFVQTGSTISAETCRAEATRACTGCIISEGIGTTTCPYTSSNAALTQCFSQGNLLGGSSATSIDCSQYTGGGSGTGGTTPTNPETEQCEPFDSEAGEECSGTIDIQDGGVVCCQ